MNIRCFNVGIIKVSVIVVVDVVVVVVDILGMGLSWGCILLDDIYVKSYIL